MLGTDGFLILSNRRMEDTPPLVSVLSIAAMYPAAVSCVIWCIQIFPLDQRDKFTLLYLTLAHPENVIAVQYLPGYRDILDRTERIKREQL